MYYDAAGDGLEQLFLAVSADGVTWTRFGSASVPVLPAGAAGPPAAWDYPNATLGAVVLRLAPNQFYMLYSGGPAGSSHYGIGCASSPDGVHWTKYAGNPIFPITDGVPWRDVRTYNPWVLLDPLRYSGHGDAVCFKMWLTGGSSSATIGVGYATQ